MVFTPIKQNATRTAALLSGEIDFVLDPAAQDLDRLRQSAKVVEGNEYRTIYLGLDQKRPELHIKGRTRSRTSACARRCTAPSTWTPSSAP